MSHWSLVQRVTGPPNPNVVVDLRNKETLNSFSYVHTPMTLSILLCILLQ